MNEILFLPSIGSELEIQSDAELSIKCFINST